jgi:hypothetical protein
MDEGMAVDADMGAGCGVVEAVDACMLVEVDGLVGIDVEACLAVDWRAF